MQPGLGDTGSMYPVQGSGGRAGAKSLELLWLVLCVFHILLFSLFINDLSFIFFQLDFHRCVSFLLS